MVSLRSRGARRALAGAAIAAFALLTTGAHAADPQATKLFNQGVKLFERGETAAACEKFSASYEIDPAPGTLFNLASCREKLGDASGAHRAYVDLAKRAEAAGKADRAAAMRQKAAALEAKLPTIAFGAANRAGVTRITVDGAVVPPEKWSTPQPIEDGKHRIQFATDRDGKTVDVTVPATGSITIDIPLLESAPPPPPPPPIAAPPPPPPRTTVPADTGSGNAHSPIAYVLGGAGIVAIGVGTYFGISAIGSHNDSLSACPNHACSSSDALGRASDAHDASQSSALVSTIAIGAGLALVAGGVTVYILSSKHKEVGIAPQWDGRTAGLTIKGALP
jgi:serine/threonine-protein kinase